MHTHVLQSLSEYSGRTAYFDPLGGNNGDTLIEMGARVVLGGLDIRLTADARDADVIIVNGSGDLSYLPNDVPIDRARQASLIKEFSNTPLILLPSSTTEHNAKRLAPLVSSRSASTRIFARDHYSFERFARHLAIDADIDLDHDMAFGLLGTEFLTAIEQVPSQPILLIVERFDEERASPLPTLYRSRLRSALPPSIKGQLKRWILPSVHARTPFVSEAQERARLLFADTAYARPWAADISLPQNHSFEEFVSAIAQSSVVVSTRLHVCILASMLGKSTLAVQSGGGDKVSGVYDFSLSGFANTKLWVTGGQVVGR